MDVLERLSKRVNEASERIATLKTERQKLLSEIAYLQTEVARKQRLERQLDQHERDRDRLRQRLTKLSRRVDKLLAVPVGAISSPEGDNEKRIE